MSLLTIETPEDLIEPIEQAVLRDWVADGRRFGLQRDPLRDAEPDGWCVVRAPACAVAVSRRPHTLMLNPLELHLQEWTPSGQPRLFTGATRLVETLPPVVEDLLAVAAARLGLARESPAGPGTPIPEPAGQEPRALARRWLESVDWTLATLDPTVCAQAQALIARWQPAGAVETAVDRELFAVADREDRYWAENALVIQLLLRLMAMPGAATGPEVRAAAQGALACLARLAAEAAEASSPEVLHAPPFRRRLQEVLRTWVHLMNLTAKTLTLPDLRPPFPVSGQPLELRFEFPPRLLHLWARRARRLAEAARRGALAGHVEPDLVSVAAERVPGRRHEMVVGVVVFAAVLLQHNQGSPELQEEMTAIAKELLPAAVAPEAADLGPASRGVRAERLRLALPRALAMGRELQRRGLSLASARPERLLALQPMPGSELNEPLHFSFPLKLGPEQPLPMAHLLTATSFSQVAGIFG